MTCCGWRAAPLRSSQCPPRPHQLELAPPPPECPPPELDELDDEDDDEDDHEDDDEDDDEEDRYA
jgi:hypothetical protein